MKQTSITNRQYAVPYILITSLFFLWGFARSILDVLNKHFQNELDISISESAMIQVTTYMAYFLMAIPAGILISKVGYRKAVVCGLMLYALGSLSFLGCAEIGGLTPFIVALFIIGCGLAILETSANPYSTLLGPRETATSRLNLSQSFNGLGSCIAPAIVGGYLFQGGNVTMPYVIMAVVVLIVALIFSRVSLPEVNAQSSEDVSVESTAGASKGLSALFWFGLAALFAYEVAEISINSYFVQFTTGKGWLDDTSSATVLSGALMVFMIGRFIGSFIMRYMKPETLLFIFGICSVVCMALVLCNIEGVSLYALITNYVFESIMFPTIFALSLQYAGTATKKASSLLIMTPVGGCAFLIVGMVADKFGFDAPFIIPLIGLAIVAMFAGALVFKKK